MESLAPQHVPVYETGERGKQLWEQCIENEYPVVAIRNGTRGYIVRYDLQHLGVELTPSALRELRRQVRSQRAYPTSDTTSLPTNPDPISATEGVGGEAGQVSGDLHTEHEQEARELAARLSPIVFDSAHWQ